MASATSLWSGRKVVKVVPRLYVGVMTVVRVNDVLSWCFELKEVGLKQRCVMSL